MENHPVKLELIDPLHAVEALTRTFRFRDSYTSSHMDRVNLLSVAIAKHLDFSAADIREIHIATKLHDIGMIAVPFDIAVSVHELPFNARELIKSHCQAGFDILNNIYFLQHAALIALTHHERLDGSGYPKGLYAPDISIGARLVGVADSLASMTSYHVYRSASDPKEALSQVQSQRGILYDPLIVDACSAVFEHGFSFPSPAFK